MKWKKPLEIPDGVHIGKIIKVEKDDDEYEYIRLHIKVEDPDIELKYSCPANLSIDSKLGKLLATFGVEYKESEEVDLEEIFLNKDVKFQTLMKPGKKNPKMKFAEIIDDTLGPA